MDFEAIAYIHDLLKCDYENKREVLREIERRATMWQREHQRYDDPFGEDHRKAVDALNKSRRILGKFENKCWS